MGFLRKAAQVGTFGLAGLALSDKKKKMDERKPQSTLITTAQPETGSLISKSGGY